MVVKSIEFQDWQRLRVKGKARFILITTLYPFLFPFGVWLVFLALDHQIKFFKDLDTSIQYRIWLIIFIGALISAVILGIMGLIAGFRLWSKYEIQYRGHPPDLTP